LTTLVAIGAFVLPALAPAVAAAAPTTTSRAWAPAPQAAATVASNGASSNAVPGIVTCTGEISGNIAGSVIVPPGAQCDLLGATVAGSVDVQPGGGLFVVGSTIDGSLVATDAAYIAIGNLEEFGGPNRISKILGSVSITGTTGTPGFPTTNVICDSTFVGGSVVLSGNKAPFTIGTFPVDCGFPGSSPAGDTIQGSVIVTGNSAPVAINNNKIGGSLTCAGNQPSPSGAANRVQGTKSGQCAGF
jgi:hexosaminidase